VCELRTRYQDLFADVFRPLHAFAQTLNSDFTPFLATFHNITDSEVNLFLNQDSFRLFRFLSDLVSLVDTG